MNLLALARKLCHILILLRHRIPIDKSISIMRMENELRNEKPQSSLKVVVNRVVVKISDVICFLYYLTVC